MKHVSKAAVLVAAAALALTGCASSEGTGSKESVSKSDITKALNTPTNLTFWTWVPGIDKQVERFEQKYPKIKVKVVNVGSGDAEYTKLRTALKAGKGAPDAAQIEYQLLSSFRVTDNLENLAQYGARDIGDDYVDWVWKQVSDEKGVWAVPQDTGPLGNLYRADILKKAGITEPATTWEQYAKDAATVKAKTGSYISNLPSSSAGQMVGLFWQAGAKPFRYDGDRTVSIDLDSPDTQKVVDYWQDLIKKDLVSTDPDFTDQWYQGFNKGKYAGWVAPAWAPVVLRGSAASTSGKWTASDIPQWKEGENVSGNWGGSSDVVLKTSKNKIAAYELVKFVNHDPASTLSLAIDQSLYPATKSTLADPKFADQKSDFYGGQQVNKRFADISKTVDVDFEWLPFMDYVYSSYRETVGKAIADKGDFRAGLTAWQGQVETFAKKQGFTVK